MMQKKVECGLTHISEQKTQKKNTFYYIDSIGSSYQKRLQKRLETPIFEENHHHQHTNPRLRLLLVPRYNHRLIIIPGCVCLWFLAIVIGPICFLILRHPDTPEIWSHRCWDGVRGNNAILRSPKCRVTGVGTG
jgi:hypothetical protein